MAATVTERPGRSIRADENGERTRFYTVVGAQTEDEAVAETVLLIRSDAELTIGGLTLSNVEATEVTHDGDGAFYFITAATWRVYQRRDPQPETPTDTGGEISFDISGQTTRIKQSLQTIASYPADAPNYKGAINVTRDGIEGTDILMPHLSFSETVVKPVAFVTHTYIRTLKSLVGKYNQASWKGFDAGTVLFVGAAGGRRGQNDYSLTYRFLNADNETGLQVGDITGIDKKAWEYLWVKYREEEQTVGGNDFVVEVPEWAYVERVYGPGDFSGIGIGS